MARLWTLDFGLWTPRRIPLPKISKGLKQFRCIGMVNRERGQVFWRRHFDAGLLQTLFGHILLERVQNHRTNVRRGGLKKVAEEVEIVFYVTKATCRRHKY